MPVFNDVLTGDAYERWIAEVTRTARIPQGSPLDPFATSLCTIDQAATELFNVVAGRPVPGDAIQTVRDLRAMHLADEGNAPTALGTATATAWQVHGAGDPTLGGPRPMLERASVLRCVLLVREAQRLADAQICSLCYAMA